MIINIISVKIIGHLIRYGQFKSIVVILLLYSFLIIFYGGNAFKKLVYVLAFYLFILIADYIFMSIIAIIEHISMEEVLLNPILATYEIGLAKTGLFVMIKIFSKIAKSHFEEKLKWKDWALLIAIPVISLLTMIVTMWGNVQSQTINFWTIINLIGLMVLNVIVFYLVDRLSKQYQMERNNAILVQQVEIEEKSLEVLEATYDTVRSISHDFKNHFACVNGLLEIGDYEEAKKYIRGIHDITTTSILAVDTHNNVIDSILNQKYVIANKRDISLNVLIHDLQELPFETRDLVTILSNALDNAIEACEKQSGHKSIDLKIARTEANIIISVTNPVHHKVAIREGNQIPTSKEDGENHGVGLRNVRMIVEKYHGDLFLDCSDTEFKFVSIFPIS